MRGKHGLIEREPLLKRLMDARRQRCVLILGQGGSGKTSTLQAWRKALLTLDYDVAWMAVAGGDGELPGLLDQLMVSLGQVDAEMVRQASLLMGHDSDEAGLEHIVIALVKSMADRQREVVIMLDDVHALDDARAFQVLQWLLDYGPDNLHLALTSRSMPPLSLERLRLQGQLTEIGMRELRFSAEESERFLRNQLGHIEPRDARALHALTDGWVAGLQLFALDLRHKRGGSYPEQELRDAQDFARYIEHEVLARHSPEDLQRLTSIAACSRFCAPLCAALLGQPESAVRMRSWLAQLERENFFIASEGVSGRDTWYRLHPLLRETLLARLEQKPEEERRALHTAAWHWFAARSEIDDAVHHAVQGGNIDAAAEMVEASARDMLSAGELNQLSVLLRRLPAAQVQARIDLHIVQAYVYTYGQDHRSARRCLDLLEARGDALEPRQRYDLLLLRAALAIQRDDNDFVFELIPQLMETPADAPDMSWALRSNVLGWTYIMRGEFEKAREAFSGDELAIAVPRSHLLGRWMAAVSLAMEGRPRQAEQMVRNVLQEAEAGGAAYVSVACFAVALLAEMLYETNECDAALGLLEPRIDLLERLAFPDTVLRALTVMSAAYAATGRAEQAQQHVTRLEAYALRRGLDRVLAESWLLGMRDLLKSGAMEAAQRLLQRLSALASRYDAGQSPGWRIHRAADRAHAEALLEFRDFSGAIGRLEALVRGCESEGAPMPHAALLLQLASAFHGLGDMERARELLVAALRIGHQNGLLRSVIDPVLSMPKALTALLADAPPDPVLAWYLRRLEEAVSGEIAEPAQAPSGSALDMLSERESEVLALVAQAMTNKKIARAVGVTPDTIKFHLKRIFKKLGVTARDEAVARWRDQSTPVDEAPRAHPADPTPRG